MTFSERELLDARARTSFFAFVWKAFTVLEPDRQFHPVWHVQAICHAVLQAIEGDQKQLLITVPPRHLKSFITSIALPAFLLGRDPSTRIMVASYGADLATSFGRQVRDLMRSDEYQRLFPGTVLEGRCTETEVRTTRGGYRLAVSPTGATTGLGADILIIDDLMKASDASFPGRREDVRAYFDNVLYSRLNNKSHGSIIAIQQRLHEGDLAAHLLTKDFRHLNLRAIAEEDETFVLPDGQSHFRCRGEALFPEHEDLATLKIIRRQIGSLAFSAQYMQNPVMPGGNMLRWEWFGTFPIMPLRDELDHVVQSWDTAYSEAPHADFSVCLTWGHKDRKWLLLDVWRKQVVYPELRTACLALYARWQPDKIIIEKSGSGFSLLSELNRTLARSKLERYAPRVGKEERFAAQTGLVEEGMVLLPREASWLLAFKQELQAFPNSKHDDQSDAFAQFLDWVRRTRSQVGRLDRSPMPMPRRDIERRDIPRRDFIRR